MDEELHDAAVRNNVAFLSVLLRDYLALLDNTNLKCEDKNALHIAAMLGNEALVRAILQANSPSSSYHMSLARDRDGRNPVHLAAMYGKLNILNLLIRRHGLIQAALAKTEGKGTILHLCVEHNQLEALQLLLGIFTDPEFVCIKNEDGMTALHLAIYYDRNQSNRREMVTWLIENAGEKMVNIKNANGKTALDLFLDKCQIDPGKFQEAKNSSRRLNRLLRQMGDVDRQILRSLTEAKAVTGHEAISSEERHAQRKESLQTRKNAIMVVAALIATMAFQAMVNPPGGVWRDDLLEGPNPHRVGEAVLAQTHPRYYRQLIRANTVAFVSSLSTIIVMISGEAIPGIPLLCYFYLLITVMSLSIAATGVTYGISFATVAPKQSRGQLSSTSEIAIIAVMVWGFHVIAAIIACLFG